MMRRLDAREVRARVSLVAVIGDHVTWDRTKTQAALGSYWAPCPFHKEKTASFHVREARIGDGSYHCFGCQVSGGSIFDFVMAFEGVGFSKALKKMAAWAGLDGGPVNPEARRRREAREAERQAEAALSKAEREARDLERAGRIWRQARGDHPLLAAYLEARLGARRARALWQLFDGPPPVLRIHPDLPIWEGSRILWRGPCLIGLATTTGGEPRRVAGVHRTWLARDGSGRAKDAAGRKWEKKFLGRARGAEIRFGPPRARMIIGEGIETTLAELGRLALGGWAADPASAAGPGWAATCGISLGNISGGARDSASAAVPDFTRPGWIAPDECRELVLLGDGDMTDPAAARALLGRAQRRHAGEGRVMRRAVRVDWAGGSAASGLDHADLALREV
ncbi:CHC2 zinc finger domain-containing protein [Neomegalonema perideroedes]|uniref:CHC2 zinc finger domain-containing protein n=1 Tax=Neomegalonema perideroedes TaxID=217219 RepID=UPI0003A869B8|nr:CHC2 zinc finger domain-containing protein [Neomegalonema perideroedes]